MTHAQETHSHPDLLTISEAAERLRVSRWTMYQLIRSGSLKTLTILSRRFVATDDITDFINRRKEVIR